MASQLNVRPAHRARRGARPRWALLRVAIALLLAVLTLPLGAMASAEDLPPGGETTEAQVLDITSEEEILDGQDGALDEQPVVEEAPAAEEPAEVAPEEPAPAPVADEKAARRGPDAGSDPLIGAVEAAVEQLVQIAAITAGELETATYDPADEQGANDEPGQKDLTKLWSWSPSGATLKIGWNWDETGWSGNNTGDACALFDVDQDTTADYAVCVTVEEDPAVQKTDVSPRVYECTTDGTNSATNCLGAVLRTGASTICEVGQTNTNPFVTAGTDTTALCTIDLDDVGGSATTVLTNVCTYPSEQPTSDDSDCVLAPRDAKLTVRKVATPADTGQLFTFNLTTDGVTQQFAQLLAGGSFSRGVSSADDANLALAEVVPDGWTLESATCDNQQPPGALDLKSGDEVTCTFTNSRDASVKVVKNWAINGTQYVDGQQPQDFAAQLTLSGVNSPSFGSTYPGFSQGDTVTIGEVEPITMPQGCENTPSGDLGQETLSGGLNEFSITNTVECAASVRVDKSWVINGVEYDDGEQPQAYAASLTLTGNEGADAFGEVYSGYTEGDTVTIGEVDPITMPAGCTNTPTGDIGTETLQRGLNEFSITNTVRCGASVRVDKLWVINGVEYDDTEQPQGYSAQLTLTGNEGSDAFGTEYSGYTQGQQVTIGEVEPITMPQGCSNIATGDIGTETLARGLNEYTITNTVTCAASVKVDKLWVINGVEYDHGKQPDGYSATLSLDEAAGLPFGAVFDGYQQGDTVSINEAYVVPDGCTNEKSGDLYQQELDKGLNTFTITNTVTCGASVKVNKVWKINGAQPTSTPPAGYSAQLTLTGNDGPDTFGTVYTGYTEGEQVTIGEVEPITMPQGCVNVASGDLGTKTLARGANVYTITNTVTCGASVRVVKAWKINGVEYDHGKQPDGYTATLTLDEAAGLSFGAVFDTYQQGDMVSVNESYDVPDGCTNVKSGDLGSHELKKGLNEFTITNTVTCGATVKVNKSWVINGAARTSTPPAGYSATLTLDGVEKAFGTEYSGYKLGDSVTVGETKVVVPEGCEYVASGDLGRKTLTKGPNVYTITNTVTCAASVKVVKAWVINGVEYTDENKPTGYSATLTLEGVEKSFGKVYSGYAEGEHLAIGETKVTVPDGCQNVATGDLGTKVLSKGLNTFTFKNTVTCGATVKVVKAWVINGTSYANGSQPQGYTAKLTLSGKTDPSFGETYGGYVEGDQLTIGEDVVVPQACVNVKSGDLGTKTLVKGSNVFTVVNTVRCETPPPPTSNVKVEKLDAVTGALIDTAKFKLWRDSGTTVGAVDAGDILVAPGEVSTGTSGNAAGTYSWSGLSQGAYILEETVAPQGYLLSQPATQAFTLGSGTTVTKQFRNPQSPTSVEVLKQDDETGEVLGGAEFQAYADNGSTRGVLDAGDTPIGAPVLTDARGVARWTGLLFGRYLFEEVAAPEGYGLPEETVQAVTLDARNAGGTIRLVFLDPGQGTLTVTKAAFELVRGEWVESDGVVEFGDQVKYVVTLTADGPKIHDDVVVSDYIPGNDPDDTTSDTEGIYVAGTAVCVEAGECTVTFDSAGQLLTWELGDVRDEARSVEFVIEFPQPADDASTSEGVYTETLANTAAATWTDRNGDQEVDSNEVVVDAELEIAPAEEVVPPPAKPRPPAEILPETGAQAGLGLWTTLGGLMLVLGAALLTWRRRQLS